MFYSKRLTKVGVVVFSSGSAGSSRRRQWGLAACVLKPPCWVGPQPLLPFLMGCLPRRWRVPETPKDTTQEKRMGSPWWLKIKVLQMVKEKHAATPHRCSHACIYRHTVHIHIALGQSCRIHRHCCSSLLSPDPKSPSKRKPPLSQAWHSAIFNPQKMIIEFAHITFQRRLPSSTPITTLVTSDPGSTPPSPLVHILSSRDLFSNRVLNGVTQQHLLSTVFEMELTEKIQRSIFDSVLAKRL